LPLAVNFTSEYAIGNIQANQGGLKLGGTHQLLVYTDNGNILGASVHALTPWHTNFFGKLGGTNRFIT
jgi:hypothetical protein